MLRQVAADPVKLHELVARLSYKPGWEFNLQDMDRGQLSEGLTFVVTTHTDDSYHPERKKRVNHFFIVPAAAYDERSWQRWLLDQLLLVESHECCEFFQLRGNEPLAGPVRPYAPSHGPGNDPYMIREVGTLLDVKTAFTGRVNA
jgi:hypothetical protein